MLPTSMGIRSSNYFAERSNYFAERFRTSNAWATSLHPEPHLSMQTFQGKIQMRLETRMGTFVQWSGWRCNETKVAWQLYG
jgi:hypothetical protein